MSGTSAVVIFSIFTFYGFIFVILGLMGMSGLNVGDTSNVICNTQSNQTAANCGVREPASGWFGGIASFFSNIGFFFKGIFFSLSLIPWWANMILFLPIGLMIVWMIIDLVAQISLL